MREPSARWESSGKGNGSWSSVGGGRQKAGVSGCLSICLDLQVLLPPGFPASASGSWIPEPLVPGAAGKKLQERGRSGLGGKGAGLAWAPVRHPGCPELLHGCWFPVHGHSTQQVLRKYLLSHQVTG